MRAPISGMSALVAAKRAVLSSCVGETRTGNGRSAASVRPSTRTRSRTLRLLRADREPVLPQPSQDCKSSFAAGSPSACLLVVRVLVRRVAVAIVGLYRCPRWVSGRRRVLRWQTRSTDAACGSGMSAAVTAAIPAAIAAQARSDGIKTLFIKSGDGAYWSQFSRSLVRVLHAGGVLSARGSSCTAAIRSRRRRSALGRSRRRRLPGDRRRGRVRGPLRVRAGRTSTRCAPVVGDYPVGLSSFPYVDSHPSFPYSVFLGPGGAHYNLPQMYWRDIGTSVGRCTRTRTPTT